MNIIPENAPIDVQAVQGAGWRALAVEVGDVSFGIHEREAIRLFIGLGLAIARVSVTNLPALLEQAAELAGLEA